MQIECRTGLEEDSNFYVGKGANSRGFYELSGDARRRLELSLNRLDRDQDVRVDEELHAVRPPPRRWLQA